MKKDTFICQSCEKVTCGILSVVPDFKQELRVSVSNLCVVAKNKLVCFSQNYKYKNAYDTLQYAIEVNATHISPEKYKNLYIDSNCKITQELIINSGYNIVDEQDKADVIVVPALPKEDLILHFDLIVYSKKNAEILILTLQDKLSNIPSIDEYIKVIIQFFKKNSYTLLSSGIKEHCPCWLLPNYSIYKDILLNDSNRIYISETKLPVTLPVKINLETLQIWHYCDSDYILLSSICCSNWESYPITLCAFLFRRFTLHRSLPALDSHIRLILSQIGFTANTSLNNLLTGRIVQPNDWNLLQDYIFWLSNADTEGFTSKDAAINLFELRDYIAVRTQIKPLKINTPMLINNIKNSLNTE